MNPNNGKGQQIATSGTGVPGVKGPLTPAKGETKKAGKPNSAKKQSSGESGVTAKKFMQVCLAFQSQKKDGKPDFEELARETGSASVSSASARLGQVIREFNEDFAAGLYDEFRKPTAFKRAADAAACTGTGASGADAATNGEPAPKKARRTPKKAIAKAEEGSRKEEPVKVEVKEEPELRAYVAKALAGDSEP